MLELLNSYLETVRVIFILVGLAAGFAFVVGIFVLFAACCTLYAKTFHVEHKNTAD